MNILQSIQNAENRATEIIKKAKKEAGDIILCAQKKETIEISVLKKTYAEKTKKEVGEQKTSLAKLYKKITDEGNKKIEKIIEKKSINKEKATQFILNNI